MEEYCFVRIKFLYLYVDGVQKGTGENGIR